MARQALAVLEELSAELTADVACRLRARGCSGREGRLASPALLASSPAGTAMNNGIYVSFSVLVSSGYMPNTGIAGSYGGFILSF